MLCPDGMGRYPDKPAEVALVLQGGKGSGKGTFGRLFGKLFGQHFWHISNPKHLTGNFNEHLRYSIVVFADEAFYAGDKSHEGILKCIITEPTLAVEGKYKNPIQVQNMIHLIIASNNDWIIPASGLERRYCVLKVTDNNQQDHQYFEAIHTQMENGGFSAMLFDLKLIDLRKVNLRKVPQTPALIEQKLHSLHGVERWIYDVLSKREIGLEIWSDKGLIITKRNTYIDYSNSAQLRREYKPQDDSGMAKTLKKILGNCIKDARPAGGSRERVWYFDTIENCRTQFSKYIGADIIWGDAQEGEEGFTFL